MDAMKTNDPVSVGVFDDLEKAQHTLDELRHHGFSADEIGIIGHVGANERGTPVPSSMRAPEQNAIRALCLGSMIGALVGCLVLVVVPGLGEISGLGRWFEILGGLILGAAAGGALMAFAGVVASRALGRLHERDLEAGRFIVTVKNPGRQGEALRVLGRQAVHSETDSA